MQLTVKGSVASCLPLDEGYAKMTGDRQVSQRKAFLSPYNQSISGPITCIRTPESGSINNEQSSSNRFGAEPHGLATTWFTVFHLQWPQHRHYAYSLWTSSFDYNWNFTEDFVYFGSILASEKLVKVVSKLCCNPLAAGSSASDKPAWLVQIGTKNTDFCG